MPKKIKKNTYWVSQINEVFQVKNIYGGFVYGYAYSRQGSKDDDIQKIPIKDFLSILKPCNVQRTLVINKDGAIIHEECARILVNGE